MNIELEQSGGTDKPLIWFTQIDRKVEAIELEKKEVKKLKSA